MKIFSSLFFLILTCIFSYPSFAAKYTNRVSHKQTKYIESEAGLIIQEWGLAIDGIYDGRLDNLIPGYKLVNVVITNNSSRTLFLDPRNDRWSIKDNIEKLHRGINHLKLTNPKIWEELPEDLKKTLEYPQAVRTGNSARIHLFFSVTTELENFREILWKSSSLKKNFRIVMSIENNLELADDDEKNSETPSYRQSLEKYGGEETEDSVQTKEAPLSESQTTERSETPPKDPSLDTVTIELDPSYIPPYSN